MHAPETIEKLNEAAAKSQAKGPWPDPVPAENTTPVEPQVGGGSSDAPE